MNGTEVRLVSASAVLEAKRVIEDLIKSGTRSGQYMASGGNVILTILGLDGTGEETEDGTSDEYSPES